MTSRSRLGKKKHGCNWKGILKIVQKAVFISISYPFSNFWFISNLYLPWYSTFCPNFSKKWSYLVHVRQGSPANYDEQRRTMTNNGEQWRTMTNNDDVMCGGGPNISKLWSVHYMKCPPNHNWCRINCSVLMDTIWNTFFVSTWHIVF